MVSDTEQKAYEHEARERKVTRLVDAIDEVRGHLLQQAPDETMADLIDGGHFGELLWADLAYLAEVRMPSEATRKAVALRLRSRAAARPVVPADPFDGIA